MSGMQFHAGQKHFYSDVTKSCIEQCSAENFSYCDLTKSSILYSSYSYLLGPFIFKLSVSRISGLNDKVEYIFVFEKTKQTVT